MRPVLTPAEAAALDRGCEVRGISTASLMENAGDALARAAVDEVGGVYGRRAVIVCGKGNNGGDGLVAARLLDTWGMRVSVVLLDGPEAFGELAAGNFTRLDETDVRVRALDALPRELARADVAIDAIFGTGFHGVADGVAAEAIAVMNEAPAPVVAADIPSGVEGATGAIDGPAVLADVTVCFGAIKPGVVLFPGAACAGAIEVADIGFPADLIESGLSVTESSDVARLLPARAPDTNKRATGVVLVVGGSRTMTGAPGLVARAAYRAGAGLVTVAVPEGILPVVEAAVPEATFVALPETEDGSVGADAFKVLWDRLGDFDAFAIGPGLGRNDETAEFARSLAAAVPEALVLDADGLNAFAGRPEELTDRGAPDLVLTPHAGEFARLAGGTAEEALRDRVVSVRSLAARTEATVLLKGSRTVIGAPGTPETGLDETGRADPVRINVTGSPALATAGSGDVLTGTIAAMLSRGLTAFDAATAGAFVHGLAGLIAGEELGDGTTAGDVCDQLPRAIRGVGA
ncbi:MAG: NAD(P)H-hydrate dehydratase [Actinomycetota bacterium]